MIKVYKVSTPAPDTVLFLLKGKGNEMLQLNLRNGTFRKWNTTPDLPPSAEYIGEIPEKWTIQDIFMLFLAQKF